MYYSSFYKLLVKLQFQIKLIIKIKNQGISSLQWKYTIYLILIIAVQFDSRRFTVHLNPTCVDWTLSHRQVIGPTTQKYRLIFQKS